MKNIKVFLSENFQFLEMKFFIYLNRRVFVMIIKSTNLLILCKAPCKNKNQQKKKKKKKNTKTKKKPTKN